MAKDLSLDSAVLPWGWGNAGQSEIVPLIPFSVSNLDLNFFQSMYLLIDLLQECARTSRLDFWTSTKVPLPLGNCQIRCSLGTRQ